MVWLASPWLDVPRKGAANEFRAPGSSTEDFFARMRLHRKRSWHLTEDEKEYLESEKQLARFTNNCGVPDVLQEWHRVYSFAAGQASAWAYVLKLGRSSWSLSVHQKQTVRAASEK